MKASTRRLQQVPAVYSDGILIVVSFGLSLVWPLIAGTILAEILIWKFPSQEDVSLQWTILFALPFAPYAVGTMMPQLLAKHPWVALKK